ncbi:hypothetical protein [Amycolatopsis sp. DSM 110486]|uniref:hypothetical protein n=1 Tax=Amycolatopsis sp. DSM 110486 TaxID=2865832 RepID=UPI001C694A87|nr:hypothetical protein [Amycolatopsis sp. DSM 110486]QYN17535.1 hypothetical protein K1T34_32640 [Amycolatopsis sp. DSM 110486]
MNTTATPTQTIETGEWTTIGRIECQRTARPITLTTGTRKRVLFEGRNGVIYDGCDRCENGTRWEYMGIHGGICYYCHGTAVRLAFKDGIEQAKKRERTNWKADRRREQKVAEQAAAAAAELVTWKAANPELARELDAIVEATQNDPSAVDGHLYELAYKSQRQPLTAKQAAYAQRLIDEEKAHAAYAATCRYAGVIGDRVTVTGKVVVTSFNEGGYGPYGPRSASMFLVVEGTGADEGVVVTVSSSAKAAFDAQRGDVMTITGAVKKHDTRDDVPQTKLGGRCTFVTVSKVETEPAK